MCLSYDQYYGSSNRPANSMKRIISFFVTVLLISFLCIPSALAAGVNTYWIDKADIRIKIPSEYIILSRTMKKDDPHLAQIGLTYEQVMKDMEQNNNYLDIIADDYSFEIILNIQDVPDIDFSLFSDTELMFIASDMINRMNNSGYSSTDYDIYHHSQTKFIRNYFVYEDYGYEQEAVSYYTQINGHSVSLNMNVYGGAVNVHDKQVLQKIVDSIEFRVPTDSDSMKGNIVAESSGFVYTDNDAGIRFSVPQGWKQEDFSTERKSLNAKFVSEKEKGVIILYASEDLWSQLSPNERIGLKRKDIDDSLFTREVFAETLGLDADKVKTVKYGDLNFYTFEYKNSLSILENSLSVDTSYAYAIYNGYLYNFQFTGSTSATGYRDFISMLKSIRVYLGEKK